jgi:hypothetical protein
VLKIKPPDPVSLEPGGPFAWLCAQNLRQN